MLNRRFLTLSILTLICVLTSGCGLRNITEYLNSDMEGSKSPATYSVPQDYSLKSVVCGVGSPAEDLISKHSTEVKLLTDYDCGNGDLRLISVDRGGLALVWKLERGNTNLARVIANYQLKAPVILVALDLQTGLVASYDGHSVWVEAIESAAKAIEIPLEGGATRLASLAVMPGGLAVVAGGADGRIYQYLIDPHNGLDQTLPERYMGSSSVISSLAIHPGSRVFFSGDWNGGLIAWLQYRSSKFGGEISEELFKGRITSRGVTRINASVGGDDPVESIKLDSSGDFLVVTTQSGLLQLWQIRGFIKLGSIQAHSGLVYAMAVVRTADSKFPRIATAGRDGKIVIWGCELERRGIGDATRIQFVKLDEVVAENISAMTFAGNEHLFIGGKDGVVAALSINTAAVEN